jgi:hypothetical protein
MKIRSNIINKSKILEGSSSEKPKFKDRKLIIVRDDWGKPSYFEVKKGEKVDL